MNKRVTPMIHVPDVRATVDWYKSLRLGFEVIDTNEDDGDLNWALLSFGDDEVMFNAGGSPSNAERREVDLYVQIEKVDQVFQRLQDRVEVRAGLNNTFYGMREFIIRDVNRFWITFGQPVRPTLEQYEQQARDLVKTCQSRATQDATWTELVHELGVGDSEGVKYLQENHPVLSKLPAAEILGTRFGIEDAQWVVAQLHKFESWDAFVTHIKARDQDVATEGLERENIRRTVSPMIHVPDIRSAVEWYKSMGFTVIDANENGDEMDWAMLKFGDGTIMFSEGRRLGPADRREFDLYVQTQNVDELFKQLKPTVQVQSELTDTFYGMREFTVRDLNGVWVIFGEQTKTTSHV